MDLRYSYRCGVVVLIACAGCVTKAEKLAYFDGDGDGFHTAFGEDWGGVPPWDCDDDDGTSFPGAVEACDGKDNDCNGTVDDSDDRVTVYGDGDGDGHGDNADSRLECGESEGWVLAGNDCDDGSDDVFPGAVEACNDLDDDCDGTKDNDAEGMSTYYIDDDDDGYGRTDGALDACERPVGYASVGDDCDDNDDNVFPGAEESCNGADDDCDEDTDEDSAVDATSWWFDGDDDGFGNEGVEVFACDAPAQHVAAGGDCDDTTNQAAPGLAEVCDDGLDNNCNASVDQCKLAESYDLSMADSSAIGGQVTDRVGIDAAVGDLNGDGIDDLVILTEGSSAVGGRAGIWFGGPSFDLSAPPSVALNGTATAYSRPLRTCIGDVSGDSTEDLVVGWARTADTDAATFAVYRGPLSASTGITTSHNISGAGGVVAGLMDLDCANVYGTPTADLLAGRGGDGGIFEGPISGALSYTSPAIGWIGSPWYSLDIDGDDTFEVLHSKGSGVDVWYGPYAGGPPDLYLSRTSDYGRVIDAGDIDQDGFQDLLFVDRYGVAPNGAIAMFDGQASAWTGELALADRDRRIVGPGTGSVQVVYARVVGDLDADGLPEVYVGGHAGDTQPARSWLVWGATLGAGDVTLPGGAVVFDVGAPSVRAAAQAVSGDFNGDGSVDLAVATPFLAANGVHVFLGTGY